MLQVDLHENNIELMKTDFSNTCSTTEAKTYATNPMKESMVTPGKYRMYSCIVEGMKAQCLKTRESNPPESDEYVRCNINRSTPMALVPPRQLYSFRYKKLR